jgi:hypothetical protein
MNNRFRPGIRVPVALTSGSGTRQLVAAKTNTRYYLTRWSLSFSDACRVKFTDGTADMTGQYIIEANDNFSGDFISIAQSGLNRPIDINTNVTVGSIIGDLWYEEDEQVGKQTTASVSKQRMPGD